MSSSRKKVILRKLSRDWVAGYLPADDFARDGVVEMLGLDGKVIALAAGQIKWACFVRDFSPGDVTNPERLLRKTFAGRPRTAGLFVRARLSDGDLIEGLAANDLSLIASNGLFLTPPDIRGNTQRLWIPVSSVTELEVIAVVGAAKPKPVAVPVEDEQKRLF
jgi:hypothetical protein